MVLNARTEATSLPPPPRVLSVLGSTGSIGTQTLQVVRLFRDRLQIGALAGWRNAGLLAQQALEFRPQCVGIGDESKVPFLEQALAGTGILVVGGPEGLREVATLPAADTVVGAIVGFAGLRPVVEAIRAGKTIALANKETLVVAGALVRDLLRTTGCALIPVDSEHSAIFQCLAGEPPEAVERLILTASGGPFRMRPGHTFAEITKAEALRHPNWSMGDKITIDSATLMNKGLEVIEAHWLFGIEAQNIAVLVHPQSIIHSMVCFRDGSMKAQLGVPDMKVPIQYALTYPERWPAGHERLDWTEIRALEFEQPDLDRFPALRLAYEALEAGGTAPAVLNAANEQAVALFLDERIGFTEIPRLIEEALAALADARAPAFEELEEADRAARRLVLELNQASAH